MPTTNLNTVTLDMRIAMPDGADDDVLDLYHWLTGTRTVTRAAKLEIVGVGDAGWMSAGDVISLSAAAVSAVSAVVQAYAAWRGTRVSPPALMITIGAGRTFPVVGGSAAEIEEIVRAVEALEQES